MSYITQSSRVLAAAVLVALATPGVAGAYVKTTSWQGNDRSVSTSSAKSITVTDGEDDNRKVKAEWKQVGDPSIKSMTNGKGWGTSLSTSTSTQIGQHRIVEVIPFRPDAVGSWYSTSTGKVMK